MKTFVIGDVHGRAAQLDLLLDTLPREEDDTVVFLGDLIDRGTDAPGVVERVLALKDSAPKRVHCLRGNHEQMLIDFVEEGVGLWLTHVAGGEKTFERYTGTPLVIASAEDFNSARQRMRDSLPARHLEFFKSAPLFYEDDFALYVHAGLEAGKHPAETDSRYLLWARDPNFFKHYHGKPCIFGHTPTVFLPLLGRIGRHGIYMSHSAIGIDTGYNHDSPLSCLSLPDLMLYQAYDDGRAETHHIKSFMPEELRTMQKKAAGPIEGHEAAISE